MEQLSFRDLTVAVLLNTDSGSCNPEAVERMREMLAEHNVQPVHMWCGGSKELDAGFAEVASHDADVLIVLGGDGTIRTAAERMDDPKKYLVPLPGGTMNVLPKALYGEGNWEEILAAVLTQPRSKNVSGGKVGSARFFVSAICGGPTLWTHAREAVREGDFIEAVQRAATATGSTFSEKIHYHFSDTQEGETEALTVTCPLVSSALQDDQKVFEAAVITMRDAIDIFGLATYAAFGSWREAHNVETVRTSAVTVSSEKSVPIILDGESIDAGSQATIEFVPYAFTALVPAS